VVAADKGTATYSDFANEIAGRYQYWLGDAFASGGSEGYDHKKMGITARGAWESVRWHFATLRLNPDTDEFTAVHDAIAKLEKQAVKVREKWRDTKRAPSEEKEAEA